MRKLNATIYRVNKWQEKCEKDRMPHVGVFYVIDGKVFGDIVPVEEPPDIEMKRFLDRPLVHDKFWSQLIQSGKRDWAKRNAFYYPRGRVTYDAVSDTFELAADKYILEDRAILDAVISKMFLPHDKTNIVSDDQYTCHEDHKS